MNKSKISYLVLSDIHLGHSRIKTDYIVNNLYQFFLKNHNLLKKLDIIFLAGDVYDRLLTTSSNEFILANEWLSMLAMYCVKHNIRLRILEGTPSHDWKQVNVFSSTIAKLGIDLDYRYISELTIETIPDLGIRILYMPDELNHDASKTLLEVKEAMDTGGISQVDIGIFHGQFHYQLPMVELPSSHTEEDYLPLVKYYINIGHIHTASVNGRILAQGSFDRLSHGEEESKGGLVMNIYSSGDMDFLFIKNENAYPHRKIDVSNMDTSEITKYLDKVINKITLGARVKVIVANSEVSALLKPLQAKYKDIIFTIEKKKKKDTVIMKNNKVEITPFEITKDNISSLINEALVKRPMGSDDITTAMDEFSDILKLVD